jgi:hypothetical protein
MEKAVTKKAATKKAVKEVARLTIVCTSDEVCAVKTKGDPGTLTAALACLMANDDEDNQFRNMMGLAIRVVLEAGDKVKKAVPKKKAAVKKAAPKKK